MAKDTLYEQEFICPCCKTTLKKYVWISELDNVSILCTNLNCSEIDLPMEPHFEEVVATPMIINGKMTKEQIHADRTKRRKEHFQKEVMPGLAPTEQLSFMNRGYRNK